MTFNLKDFKELNTKLNDAIDVILIQEAKRTGKKIEKIDDHPNEVRRYQLQFLKAVFTELEKKLSEKKGAEHYSALFGTVAYAAMLTITREIENKYNILSEERSLLFTSLQTVMGITDKDKPSNQQISECFNNFNAFIRLIYVDNDSRKGLKSDHALQKVPADKLIELVQLSLKVDQEVHDDADKELKIEGKTVAPTDRFVLKKDIEHSIVEQFESFEKLSGQFQALIKSELGDKNVADISRIKHQGRSSQLHYLYQINEELKKAKNAIKPDVKLAILAGAMYVIRGQISREYKIDPLNKDIDVNSKIHTELTKVLNAKKESLENIEVLISTADQFVRYICIETVLDKKAAAGKKVVLAVENEKDVLRLETVFGPKFDPTSIFKITREMIKICRSEALNICVEATKPKEEKATGYLASFWTSKPKSTPVKESGEKDKELKSNINVVENYATMK